MQIAALLVVRGETPQKTVCTQASFLLTTAAAPIHKKRKDDAIENVLTRFDLCFGSGEKRRFYLCVVIPFRVLQSLPLIQSCVSFRARKPSLKQRYCIDFRRVQGPSGQQPRFECATLT